MKQQVKAVIDATLASLKSSGQLSFESIPNYNVEVPKDASHGDWSCNVAMVAGKATGKKPPELAELIIKNLVDANGIVVGIEKAGPGFLNLRLKDSVFQAIARDVLKAGATFGRQAPKSTGKKVMVEFVSANPTGPVHIGHARGAFMGDAIARLLDAAGHDVTREFYINDFGKQVETLGRTVYKRYQELFGVQVTLADGEYPAAYVIDIARAWKEEIGDSLLNKPESEWLPKAIAFGMAKNLESIRKTLGLANISHDVFFSEKSLHDAGKVRSIVDVYKARGVTYEAEKGERREKGEKVRNEESKAAQFADKQLGGTFLRTATYKENEKYVLKDEEDRVILRHDGTPVYLTADLAYHKEKFDRGFDLMVDVFGADHAGHVPRIQSGVKLLGYDEKKLQFVLVQIVKILRDGEEVKVSKRKGNVFELEELIEEAGADVCRFIFLMKTANAQFDFDLSAVEKQSKDNPVFYFQYGHARCASILRKAEEKGVAFVGADRLTEAQLAKLVLPEEKVMLKKMSQLSDVVQSAADKLEPHHVLYFCQELIADFHGYYTKYRSDPVVSDDVDKTQGRLALVAAIKHTLKSAFGILGISAPESMVAPQDEEAEA
ncbi:MAG: arginine--tRNA ligase [Archangium gephyra]|uniref:Arginine--tRNA ligase n=1 Tax=Archangium gephyra TaxID=48 RepID=A0A2W5T8K1_9BACT|nr:MAG: arginine--tRNA ligase [Archangium gephyra]